MGHRSAFTPPCRLDIVCFNSDVASSCFFSFSGPTYLSALCQNGLKIKQQQGLSEARTLPELFVKQ